MSNRYPRHFPICNSNKAYLELAPASQGGGHKLNMNLEEEKRYCYDPCQCNCGGRHLYYDPNVVYGTPRYHISKQFARTKRY